MGAVIYVDPANGTDNADANRGETPGTGSVTGTGAYASLSYALANYASFSATEQNIIYLADTSANVLSSTIDFDTSVAAVEAPLLVIGFHYDGSNGGSSGALTLTLPSGDTIPCGEIDGNDAVAYFCDLNTTYCTFVNLKIHDTTTYVVSCSTGVQFINCEIYDAGTLYTASTVAAPFINCRVYDSVGAGGQILRTPGNVFGCRIYGGDEGIYTTASSSLIAFNTIYANDDRGIQIAGDYISVFNNSIDGTGANASSYGIEINLATAEHTRVFDNIIANWSNTSAVGIQGISGGPYAYIDNNAYYNNTSNTSTLGATVTSSVTESSTPFTAAGSGDFSLVSGANSNDAGSISLDGSTNFNIGSYQVLNPAAGETDGDKVLANSTIVTGNVALANVLSAETHGTYVVASAANVKTGVAFGAASAETGTYDGSDRWTDPGEANVESGVAYKANSVTNNKTGTFTAPAVGDVRLNVQFGGAGTEFTGTNVMADAAEVSLNYQYGAGGTEFTGTQVLPTEGDVRSGTTYGTAAAYTGSLALPAESEVLSGIAFGDGAEFTGNVVLPAVGDVQTSVTFGASSGLTGTLALPAITAVLDSVQFGAGGVEFTGTYHAPDAAEVVSTAVFGPSSGTSGTVTLPAEAEVESGVQFGAGGTEFTGSLVASGGADGCVLRGGVWISG